MTLLSELLPVKQNNVESKRTWDVEPASHCRASNARKGPFYSFFLGMTTLSLYKSYQRDWSKHRACFLPSWDNFLGTFAAPYVHFFLFICPACRNCLASVCSSLQGNLEPADAHIFSLQCHCGWAGKSPGFVALRHWVEMGEYINLAGIQHCSLDYAA